MNRPRSQKNKPNRGWGLSGQQEPEHAYGNVAGNKMNVRVIRPDLTTNDFSRILPRKMYKDKQRLYSEGLQLKQAYNQVSVENVRLKTQLSMVEKEKYRISRLNQSGEGSKLNHRDGMLPSKGIERENKAVRGYKQMIRQLKQEKMRLLTENSKIKKSLKYLKTNQLQIQLKIVIGQNQKLAQLLEKYSDKVNDNVRLQTDYEDIQGALEKQYESNKQMAEQNMRLVQELEDYELRFKSQQEKWRVKENKINRDLMLQRKKTIDNQRHIEDLRREVKTLVDTNQRQSRKRSYKLAHRSVMPANSLSHPGRISGLSDFETEKASNKERDEINQILSTQNQNLLKEIKQLRVELQSVKTQLARQLQNKRLILSSSLNNLQLFADSKMSMQRLSINDDKQLRDQSDIKMEVSYQDDQFQAVELKASRHQRQLDVELSKIKHQFNQPDEEEFIFKKEEEAEENKEKITKTKNKRKNKSVEKAKGAFKANKAMLAEIKQILTYRMKSQRYPFADLKADIEVSEQSAFKYLQLMQMLSSQPFYLKKEHTETFLQYCYQKEKIEPQQTLDNKVLVEKIRKVIGEFELMTEQKEKEMIIRIAEMASSYPEELQLAFENIKNGEQTVSKAKLAEMFKKLELEDQYIELVVSELSLCSEDLEHLNFYGFFQRFYIGDEYDENAIEEIEEQSQESPLNSSRVKKDTKKNNYSKRSKEKL